MFSGVALSFQSRESPLDTKVKSFLSLFIIFNCIIFLLKNQYNTPQPITRQNGTTQGSTTTTHYNPLQDKTGQPTTVQRQPKTFQNNTGKLQSYAVA